MKLSIEKDVKNVVRLKRHKFMKKMSKSDSTDANIIEKPEVDKLRSIIAALESEVKYWKLRHSLVVKYGNK